MDEKEEVAQIMHALLLKSMGPRTRVCSHLRVGH